MNLTHWQSTALALLGFITGMALHLRWHPLRRHLSDAWDLVRFRPFLVVLCAGAALLASAVAEIRPASLTLVQLSGWREVVLPLARESAAHLAQLPHVLIQPWPLALLTPFALAILTIRIWRWPYRYGERRPGVEQKTALLVATLAGVGWLALEASSLRSMQAEALETLKLSMRYVFTALAGAGMQVWLARLVIAWEKPQDTNAERDATDALEHTFARWQGVCLLAGFNLSWMLWRLWQPGVNGGLGAWLWIEYLLLFAALPLAVASVSGPFWHQGAAALKILLRSVLPLLGLAFTAFAVVLLARYASAMAHALVADSPLWRFVVLPLDALVLAMLDCWLLLAALLIMLRHGFPRPPTA
ncbi:MAG: hypothetical protein R3F13_17205 [Prosthecobacter sp.]